MGLGAGLGRAIAAPLLVLNLLFTVIILGLAGRVLDKSISGQFLGSGFRGNGATPYLVLFSILAGMTSIASILTGIHHLWHWRASSGAASQATAWISWLLLVIAFCLAWKEIHLGGRGIKLRVLEAVVILLTFSSFVYTLVLYLGEHHDDGGAGHAQPKGKFLNPNAPRAASAV